MRFPDSRVAKAQAATAAGYSVRAMEPGDATQVAHVHVEVWRAAYATVLPENYLANLHISEYTERWSSRLAHPSPHVSHLVGLRPDGTIVAAGTVGPSRDPDKPAPVELYGLLVLARDQGTGMADVMMQRLIGHEQCSLWVLEGNARAIAFYRAYGFRMDGRTQSHPPTGAIEHRMSQP